MKVLVTGATGGLGQLVMEKLLAMGHQVIATSRNAEKAALLPYYGQIVYKPYDIGSPKDINLFDYFERPDAAIHLAWEKLNEYKNPAHLEGILESHKAFVQNLATNGLKSLTGVGTCYEYGLREGELTEDMPALATMPYPQAKNLLREYIAELQQAHSFSFKWLRVFYVFGEIKERRNLYTLLMAAIQNGEKTFNMSGGEQVRDFLSPDEIAAIITDAALQNGVQGVINCCSGRPVKLKAHIRDFLAKNNYQIDLNLGFYPYPDYEPMETWGSVEKLNGIYQNPV